MNLNGASNLRRTSAVQTTARLDLTREQIATVQQWLADAAGVPADRAGYLAVIETPNGGHRRRAYLSLEAAHRAVRRAEARGVTARVVLCELRPVQP